MEGQQLPVNRRFGVRPRRPYRRRIAYRLEEQEQQRLRAMGVRAFPSLVYPHKPAMAEWLNAWAVDFAAQHDAVLTTATFFPEPSAAAYVGQALGRGGAGVQGPPPTR